MINKIYNYISKIEIKKMDLDFKNFLQNDLTQRWGEIKINFNRFKQTIRIILGTSFLFPSIIKNYSKLLLFKDYPLRSVEISLTYQCNATCEQCSCRLAYSPSKRRLSLDEFKKAIDDSIRLGAFQFNITGGEPLLHFEECVELIRYIKFKGKYVHLCTNALLANFDLIYKCKKAGLDSIEMGLDSADERIHNSNRKENSYKKIMETIELAKRAGIKTIILNTIITKEKIKSYDMIALMNLAKEKRVILQITPPCVTGAWKNRLDILLSKEERIYLRWLLARYPHSRMDTYSSYFGIRCPAAREKICIQPYGDVVPCSLIQIVYGNIKTQELEKIRKKMLENPYYHLISKEGCLPSFNKDFIEKYMPDK
jgi:MoaA/NifB/PqqE/SkfB family radical SAM enzyme